MACSVAERLSAVKTAEILMRCYNKNQLGCWCEGLLYSEMRIIRVIVIEVTLFLFYTIKQILIANYLDL